MVYRRDPKVDYISKLYKLSFDKRLIAYFFIVR